MIVAGKLGLNIAATSFCNSFKVTATSDDNVFKENDELCQLIEDNLMDEIKKHEISLEIDDKKTR